MEVVARLDNVTKTYGQIVALDAVSIAIPQGVTAILGANGAGKSTAIDILAGLRRPISGRVEVLGGDPASLAVRARLGLSPQATALPWRLTVAETLHLLAAHYPDPIAPDALADRLDLHGIWKRRNGTLSGGQRRRVVLASALVGNPDLVFLDEPTTGLDVESRDLLWTAIEKVAAEGRSVLLTSHNMPEVERLASHVVVIAGGRVSQFGSVDDVCANVGLHVVEAELPGPLPEPVTAHAVRVEPAGTRTRLYTADPDATVRALVRHDVPFRAIRVDRVGLEEAIRTAAHAQPRNEPVRTA